MNIKYLDEIDSLKDRVQTLREYLYLIENCLGDASEDTVFICVKKIKKLCQEFIKSILQKGSTLVIKSFDLKSEKLLDDLLSIGPNDLSKLVRIHEKETTAIVTPDTVIASDVTYSFEHIAAKPIQAKLKLGAPTYNCLLYLANNNILLVDSDKGSCCLLDDQYREIASRKFISGEESAERGGAFRRQQYAADLGNDLIAISLTTDKKICFVSSSDLTYKGEIVCQGTPKAICALSSCELAISWEDPVAFGIIVLQGGSYSEICYFTKDKTGRVLKTFDHMTVDKKLRHIIQPCAIDRMVYCFRLDGEPVFVYKNDELTQPRGVAVNSDGIIFVCNMVAKGSIHILSEYGLPVTVVKESVPTYPLAVTVTKEGDRFAVS